MTPLKLITFLCLFFFVASIQGQTLKGVIKKKANKAIDNAAKTLEGKDKTSTETDDEVQVVNRDEKGRSVPIKNFIDRNSVIFHDDFTNERPTMFPSKWTQINGGAQNNQIITGDKKDGVVETISSSVLIKPTIKGDNYLGKQFKIEMKVYFHEKGNEAYVIQLKNSKTVHGGHNMRISGGVMWSGSDPISRAPGIAKPGWHTFQISFSNGYIKGWLDGRLLINDSNISTAKVTKNEFTSLEVSILSPSLTLDPPLRQMITDFTIGGKGHDLYNRLSSDEGLVEHINFANNSYIIQKSSYPVLNKIAKVLVANPNTNITIAGHTDANGTNEANRVLGQKRADAVKNYLQNRNVAKTRMITISYGEEMPVNAANTSEAWKMNRRVVFRTQR